MGEQKGLYLVKLYANFFRSFRLRLYSQGIVVN